MIRSMTAPGKMLRAGRYSGLPFQARGGQPFRVSAFHAAAALSPYPVAAGKASKYGAFPLMFTGGSDRNSSEAGRAGNTVVPASDHGVTHG
jgi:hypothetical protein